MIFDKLKELVLKNKIYFVCLVSNVISFCVLFVLLAKMTSLKNFYKKELEYCAYLLESVYAERDNRMERIMQNIENDMEKADKMYDKIIGNLH